MSSTRLLILFLVLTCNKTLPFTKFVNSSQNPYNYQCLELNINIGQGIQRTVKGKTKAITSREWPIRPGRVVE
jgi:hypothetical protein